MSDKKWSLFLVRLSILLLLLCIIPPGSPYTYLPEREPATNSRGTLSASSVTDIKELRHHVLIVYESKFCSGTLTGSRIVVTAATCFARNKGEPVVVKVGSNSMVGSGQIISVLEYKIHEYFQNLSCLDNDIALLILMEHVLFDGNVIKAQLVESEVALRDGIPLKVSGWGGTVCIRFFSPDCATQRSANDLLYTRSLVAALLIPKSYSPDLPVKYVNLILVSEMTVINKTECEKTYKSLLTPSNFCVQYKRESRLSDNGGGATFDNIFVGILSWGANGKNINNVAILTNVSYFERWIRLNTRKFLTKYCVVKNERQKLDHSEEYLES